MTRDQSIDEFIVRFAAKISHIYPNGYSDKDDYIQTGHLKLAEIKGEAKAKEDFLVYAITCIARAIRRSAINSMCAASAPYRIKMLVYKVDRLLACGYTELEICKELEITKSEFTNFRTLFYDESWCNLFDEPTEDSEPFSAIGDILDSGHLTDEDVSLIKSQLDGTIDDLGLDRNQLYRRLRSIGPKLIRSGYGK